MIATEPVLAVRLRALAVATAIAGAVLAVLAFVPAERVYVDANHCLASAFELVTEQAPCTPRYDELAAQHDAGGFQVITIVVLLVVPAIAVWRRPTRDRAWLWAAMGPAGVAGCVTMTFEVHRAVFGRVEVLPIEHVVHVLEAVFVALVVVVLPALLVAAEPRAAPPEARVVTS